MLIGKKEFIAGLLIATLSVSAATQLTSLYAIDKQVSSEVEFSQKVGLFDSERLSAKTLKSNIAEIAFYRGLNLILANMGIVDSFNTANLESLGITNTTSPMSSITRQKATETILRALMHANSRGNISINTRSKDIVFKDWKPSDKYQDATAFAIENNIIRGVGQNLFKPSKKLTVREALILFQRIYELKTQPAKVSSSKNIQGSTAKSKDLETKTVYIEPEIEKFFKDVSPSNAMAETMKKLINAGAFDLTVLNNEASLPKSIKISDFVLVCKGILNKVSEFEVCKSVDDIVSSLNSDEALTRDTLAEIGSVMADIYPHQVYDIKASYADVENAYVEDALKVLGRSGIRMGYSDGTFKGSEKVSRYEAFNLLSVIIGNNVGSKIKITTIDADKVPALQPAEDRAEEKQIDNKKDISEKPQVKQPKTNKTEERKSELAPKSTNKDYDLATILERQMNKKYSGLTFLERMELRKAQFRKILNCHDDKE